MTEAKQRILVIDDDLGVLKLLRRFLEPQFEVFIAPVAYDFETLLKSFAPHLVILDVRLPDANGLVVSQRMRTHEEFRHIPIILISGSVAPSEAVMGYTGADSFLSKPFDLAELGNTLRRLILPPLPSCLAA